MTQDEIIEMAVQAGFKMENSAAIQAAKAFYKLVAAKALAQPEQEPVVVCCQQYDSCLKPCTPRGEHLKQRTWVRLAKEDRLCAKYMQDAPDGIEAVIDYIESKLKELNT